MVNYNSPLVSSKSHTQLPWQALLRLWKGSGTIACSPHARLYLGGKWKKFRDRTNDTCMSVPEAEMMSSAAELTSRSPSAGQSKFMKAQIKLLIICGFQCCLTAVTILTLCTSICIVGYKNSRCNQQFCTWWSGLSLTKNSPAERSNPPLHVTTALAVWEIESNGHWAGDVLGR